MSTAKVLRRPHFRGLNLLPQLFETSLRGVILPPLGLRHALWLAAILMPPLALTLVMDYGHERQFQQNEMAHSLIEGFCALMSLVVFYVLHQEFIGTGTCRLRLLAFAFLCLGLLDGCHAISQVQSQLFVWFRSTAALLSSAMMVVALNADGLCRKELTTPVWRAYAHAAGVATATLTAAGASYLFRNHLPQMVEGDHFTAFTLIEKGMAGTLYLIAGITFLHYFRRSREMILFVLAVAVFLFAESQWLAFYSNPWDRSWWIWHWIRTGVFAGIVFGIAHQFVMSARDLQDSHLSLVEAERLASLGEMAASVAHEIRNPLGTLTGSVALLKDEGIAPEERDELIDLIDREINRLNHIVSDTLEFARPIGGRMHIVNVETVLRQAIRSISGNHPRVDVEVAASGELPLIRADEILLQRIAWNLIENSASAMSEEGKVSVVAHAVGDQVVVEFTDNGPGMAAEIASQAGKPFFTTKEHGVGLGLPMVQRMVVEQGGTMDIRSEPGRGTSVCIGFPAVTARS